MAAAHFGVNLWGHLKRISWVGRTMLNVGHTIPWTRVPPKVKGKSRQAFPSVCFLSAVKSSFSHRWHSHYSLPKALECRNLHTIASTQLFLLCILVIHTKSEPIHDRFQVNYMWEKNICNQGHKGTKIFTRDECTNGPTIWQSLLRISMATSYTVICSQRRLLLGALVNVRRDAHGSMADVSGSM